MAGLLYIVSAPSGAGKTSLLRALLAADPGLRLSVSHTTRAPRPGERDGEHYHFVSTERFQALVAADAFLEHANVHGYGYGTARATVEAARRDGVDLVLEIDWQGAAQVRRKVPGTVSIFILPPSRAVLRERLERRGQDSAEVIARRLANARGEIAHAAEFDYWVINEHFDRALADLKHIVAAARLARDAQQARHRDLIAQLLAD